MTCCLDSFLFLKKQLNQCFYIFDNYLNKILEIEIKDKKDEEYNLIDLKEINKDEDHVIIDIPINTGYNII